MATATKQTQKVSKEIAAPAATSTELNASQDMFASDAGAGMEGATHESFAIPFLMVLQKGSPQVDEASGSAIEGAKQGMFYENVTGRMFDGKVGVEVVPCHYRRVFLRWKPRSSGGGFGGELATEVVAEMRARGEIVELNGKLYVPLENGAVDPEKCDRISDVRNHYILLVDENTGGFTQALMSLGSTQIKKSKMLMSALASVRMQSPAGAYQPATFANRVKVSTVPESNDKGSWMGLRFELSGFVSRPEVYAAAKAFHESVKKGTVEVKYEDAGDTANEPSQGAAKANGF